MSITLAQVTQYLLQDDFSSDTPGPVSSTTWDYSHWAAVNNPSYIPSTLGSYPPFPGTQMEQYLPSVSNGALQLTLQTYNPTGAGNSFLGSEIISNETFSTNYNNSIENPGGIAFTAVAKLATTVPGIVGGIFGYNYISSTDHNEIDFESLTDDATAQNNQEQTNVYSNQQLGRSNPLLVSDPSLTTYQTYTMEWFPNEVLWFVNGVLVRQSSVVPQGSMQFDLNVWAYDAELSGSLQPVDNLQSNTIYTFDVQSVSVARIKDINTTVTISGTAANQPTSDTSSLSPLRNVVVTDLNPGQTDTVTVTLSAAANGTLSNLGGGSYNATTGVYTDTGAAAAVTTALDGLVFTPTAHQVAPGQTVTTTFTIIDTDSVAATATDSTTTVVATAAPTLVITSTGDPTNQTTQTISGTIDVADAGLTVSIYDGATLVGTAKPLANGAWSTSVTLPSTQGTQWITAQATNAAGNVGTSAPVTSGFIDLLNFEASFPDLIKAFGANQPAMQNWCNTYESTEKRVETFNGLDYIASYGDLITAFASAGSQRAVQDDGAYHYIEYGYNEGRTTTFDGLAYIASYSDLINAFASAGSQRAVQDDGAYHDIEHGHNEGRATTFDGLAYIASYGDLIKAFASAGSEQAVQDDGAYHYIEYGHNEGRTTTFDGLDYIASYSDLIKAFASAGSEQAVQDDGAYHYIEYGHNEGRTTTFDGLAYIADYTDLMLAFGANNDAGAYHYIEHGYHEGRTTTFNVAAYETAHPDLTGKYATNDQFLTAYINTYNTTGHFLT
jgi:plastocyanin